MLIKSRSGFQFTINDRLLPFLIPTKVGVYNQNLQPAWGVSFISSSTDVPVCENWSDRNVRPTKG